MNKLVGYVWISALILNVLLELLIKWVSLPVIRWRSSCNLKRRRMSLWCFGAALYWHIQG